MPGARNISSLQARLSRRITSRWSQSFGRHFPRGCGDRHELLRQIAAGFLPKGRQAFDDAIALGDAKNPGVPLGVIPEPRARILESRSAAEFDTHNAIIAPRTAPGRAGLT